MAACRSVATQIHIDKIALSWHSTNSFLSASYKTVDKH